MAVSTATISYFGYPRGNDNTQRNQIRRGTIAISTGGTYPPGGFPLDWSSEGNKSIPLPSTTPSSTGTIKPIDVDVKSTGYSTQNSGGPGPSGFIYIWDSVQGNLHIFVANNAFGASAASGPLIELGGNIPNTVVTDTIQFTAVFARND